MSHGSESPVLIETKRPGHHFTNGLPYTASTRPRSGYSVNMPRKQHKYSQAQLPSTNSQPIYNSTGNTPDPDIHSASTSSASTASSPLSSPNDKHPNTQLSQEYSNSAFDHLDTTQVVNDYMNYRLSVAGYNWVQCPQLPAPNNVRLTMRVLCDQLESLHAAEYDTMISDLHLTPAAMYPTYVAIANQLFDKEHTHPTTSSKINWGRIVTLFSFSGRLAVYCTKRADLEHMVGQIVDWLTQFTVNRLLDWVQHNGGWEGAVVFYNGRERDQQHQEAAQSRWRNPAVYFGVAAAVGAGAVLLNRTLSS